MIQKTQNVKYVGVQRQALDNSSGASFLAVKKKQHSLKRQVVEIKGLKFCHLYTFLYFYKASGLDHSLEDLLTFWHLHIFLRFLQGEWFRPQFRRSFDFLTPTYLFKIYSRRVVWNTSSIIIGVLLDGHVQCTRSYSKICFINFRLLCRCTKLRQNYEFIDLDLWLLFHVLEKVFIHFHLFLGLNSDQRLLLQLQLL